MIEAIHGELPRFVLSGLAQPAWSPDGTRLAVSAYAPFYWSGSTPPNAHFRFKVYERGGGGQALMGLSAMESSMPSSGGSWSLIFWRSLLLDRIYNLLRWAAALAQTPPTPTPTATAIPQPQGLLPEYYNGFSVLDEPITQGQPDAWINFEPTWPLPAAVLDRNRFSVRWTGQIQFALPMDEELSTPTPTPTPTATTTATPEPTITPTPTLAPNSVTFTFCVTTAGVVTNMQEEVKLWIASAPISLTKVGNEWCGELQNSNLDGIWREIHIQYWRFAAPDAINPPEPRFVFKWQASSSGQIFPKDIVPSNRLRPTPSSTMWLPGSLRDLATCPRSDGMNKVIVVPVFPGRSQEAKDMLAIASDTGLLVHEGPTINSSVKRIIAWGEFGAIQVEANPWIEFAQDGRASWVWYKLANANEWIAARFSSEENGQNKSYHYLIGVSDTRHPCDNQNVPPIPPYNGTITFTYDRTSAAQYAIAQAYRNSIPSAQSGQSYPGINRVTKRLSSDILIDGQPIPFINEVEFANFTYDSISGDPGSTGSAVFNSEALWMGGLPMTHNVDNEGITVVESCGASNSNDLNLAGWRHCAEGIPNGSSTRVWRTHQGIVVYYSEDSAIGDNNVIAQHGQQVALFELLDEQGVIRTEFNELAGNLRVDGAPGLDENSLAFFDRFINPVTLNEFTIDSITTVRTGDYIFINRQREEGHGFFIAGWGAVMSCPVALGKVWSFSPPISNTQGQLFQTFAATGGMLVVPYVVDFPGPIDPSPDEQLQRPRARPFYCSQYINPNFFELFDGLAFYTFSDAVTIPVNRVFVSPSWEWEG